MNALHVFTIVAALFFLWSMFAGRILSMTRLGRPFPVQDGTMSAAEDIHIIGTLFLSIVLFALTIYILVSGEVE